MSVHITHFLQFLNVNVFQSFKQQHAESVNKTVKLRDDKFDKLKFLTIFNSFRSKTFKIFTIKHVFRKTGIWPYNPNVVLDQLRVDDEESHQIQNEDENEDEDEDEDDSVKTPPPPTQQSKWYEWTPQTP